ncbi:MAG: hypothetical protein H0V01_09500 [Bacteroidetes bacterium]|nr:hypothetical protein [Bacteroidota bacterium]HET6243024.1 hypothetical protein [Bacteroidia bacterium]
MNRFTIVFFTVIVCLLYCSCNIINPSEEIPSYIKIDTITFENDPGQSISYQKITDAWVYVDDQLVGTYELPVTFPVLAKGNRQILIRPGIIINGIGATRGIYPFFESYGKSVDLNPNETSVISPTVKYHSSYTLPWSANFETEIKIERLPGSLSDIKRVTDPAILGPFNGIACGAILLDADSNRFAGASLTDFPLSLPRTSQPIFLELSYKSNNLFSVGIIARNPEGDQGQTILNINPSSGWNKIYVNLTETVNLNINAAGYYFFIHAQKSDDVSQAEIYIDDLKILY